MSKQISSLEKADSDRMMKERESEKEREKELARKGADKKDLKLPVRNNDSDVAPEKDKNDVMRGHE